jgi:transcriptional regulator with XRE-family HTH domain
VAAKALLVPGYDRELSTRQVRERLGVSQERLAHVLSVTSRTVERWEKIDELPSTPDRIRRLKTLAAIAELGEIVFGKEAFRRFLKLPQPVFGARTPWETIERGDAEHVYGVLAAEYEGLGF